VGRLILLLGGNQGDVRETISMAHSLLEKYVGDIVEISAFYESEPWGFDADNNFINQVAELDTLLLPEEVLTQTQSIEKFLGRERKSTDGYTSRPIDIDILFFDDLNISLPDLTIPHPRLHERMFTLLPLSEKWEELLHPVFNKTIAQMLEECSDTGRVRKAE
jgi:2-amino-4-hydroxy-6-hydroxymethyldihydropteridine diphosphokinase